MSADNGVYILQSLDGFRVIHAQAIENLYWWEIEDCGKMVDRLNPQELKRYFGKCKVFSTKEEADKEAQKIYDEIMKDDFCPIVEYGISYIKGWENKFFPDPERKI